MAPKRRLIFARERLLISAFLNFPFGRIIIPLDSIDSPNKVTEILPRTVVTYLKETSIHNLANR